MSDEDVVVNVGMELQCPDVGCMLGENGGRFKTKMMNSKDAFQMLTMHVQFNHPQPQVVHGAPQQ